MLSDEERQAIKFLEKLKDLKIILSCSFWNNGEFEFNNIQKEQFDIILGLIEKQSKEIEELKDKNKTLKNLQNDTNGLYIGMIERKNYFERELQKLEDKIKEKIEEVKDGTYDAKIVLQSLLEKE